MWDTESKEERVGPSTKASKHSRAIQEGNAVAGWAAARAQVMAWMVIGHWRPALPFIGGYGHVQIESNRKNRKNPKGRRTQRNLGRHAQGGSRG